jgi:hypothetical protein
MGRPQPIRGAEPVTGRRHVPRMLILNVDFVTRNALKGIILSCVFEGLCPVDGPDRCCGL